MKEFLSSNQIDFQELNVAENAQAREELLQKVGRSVVPVTTVNDSVVIGFNRTELEKLLFSE